MTQLFSESEKEALSSILGNPLLTKAITVALSEAGRNKRGKDSMEESAMAFQYLEGARELIEILYGFAEIKKSPQVLSRKLIHHQ